MPGIDWKLGGSNEDSAEASAFLGNAFGAAIFLIFIVLLAQFNKFTSVFLVLSCVVMATIGALLGMMLTGQAFVIVMSGIGVIALAGVVVNNNIVLIDTYDRLREEGWNKLDAVLQTCRERARPVVLTAHVGDPRRAADRLRPRARDLPPRDDDQRAVDAVVDRAVVGDRLRPVLRDGADAGGDAVHADGVHARQATRRASAASSAGCSDGSGGQVDVSTPSRRCARPGAEGAFPKAAE